MTLEEKIAREVSRQVGPLNAVLSQIWTEIQAMKAASGEALIDPDTGEPIAAPPLGAGEEAEPESPPAGWFQPLGQPDPQAQTADARPDWGPALAKNDEQLNAEMVKQMEHFTATKIRMQQAAAQNRMAEIEAQIAARMAVWQGAGGSR